MFTCTVVHRMTVILTCSLSTQLRHASGTQWYTKPREDLYSKAMAMMTHQIKRELCFVASLTYIILATYLSGSNTPCTHLSRVCHCVRVVLRRHLGQSKSSRVTCSAVNEQQPLPRVKNLPNGRHIYRTQFPFQVVFLAWDWGRS